MALQEHSICPSTIFLMACFNIIELADQHQYTRKNIFSDFFINVNAIDQWKKIQLMFVSFGADRIIATGETPSKDIRQSDGMGTPFYINKGKDIFSMMYDNCISEGLLTEYGIDKLSIFFDDFIQDSKKTEISIYYWMMLSSSYEMLYEIEKNILLLYSSILSMKNMYFGSTKSPGQLKFYGGDNIHGGLLNHDGIRPWVSYEQEKTVSIRELPYGTALSTWAIIDGLGQFLSLFNSGEILILLFSKLPKLDLVNISASIQLNNDNPTVGILEIPIEIIGPTISNPFIFYESYNELSEITGIYTQKSCVINIYKTSFPINSTINPTTLEYLKLSSDVQSHPLPEDWEVSIGISGYKLIIS